MISVKLVKILKKWKIPLLHAGGGEGRHRILSFMFLIFMSLLISIYLLLMYLSHEFALVETSLIAAAAGLSIFTYMLSVFVKPQYAPLPEEKSDEEFLDLLKNLAHEPNKKVCAYCQIEKTEGAIHCFICKRCVLEHDRHCFLLNNCIGKKNRPYVMLYFLITIALLGMMSLSSFLHITNIIGVADSADQVKFVRNLVISVSCGSSFVALLMALALISLCRSHRRAKKGILAKKSRTNSVSAQSYYTKTDDPEKRFEEQLRNLRRQTRR